jgi:hypothetical protein
MLKIPDIYLNVFWQARRHLGEISIRRGIKNVGRTVLSLDLTNRPHILFCWSSAMIANTKKFHRRAHRLSLECSDGPLHVSAHISGIVIGQWNPICQDASSINSLPQKKVLLDRGLLCSIRAHENVIPHPLKLENLRNIAVMSKRIGIVAHIRAKTEEAL